MPQIWKTVLKTFFITSIKWIINQRQAAEWESENFCLYKTLEASSWNTNMKFSALSQTLIVFLVMGLHLNQILFVVCRQCSVFILMVVGFSIRSFVFNGPSCEQMPTLGAKRLKTDGIVCWISICDIALLFELHLSVKSTKLVIFICWNRKVHRYWKALTSSVEG